MRTAAAILRPLEILKPISSLSGYLRDELAGERQVTEQHVGPIVGDQPSSGCRIWERHDLNRGLAGVGAFRAEILELRVFDGAEARGGADAAEIIDALQFLRVAASARSQHSPLACM